MAKIIIHQEKVTDRNTLLSLCPFSAIEADAKGELSINSGCRMCRICCKKGNGVFEYVEDEQVPKVDKSQWQGIAVVAELVGEKIHPVTMELLGKARSLAQKIGCKVFCVLMGSDLKNCAEELSYYGADQVFVYDHRSLAHFRVEVCCAVLEEFIKEVKPSVVLVGGTSVGRSLAPRCAARFRTGLTADCTVLDIQPNTDLDQIRPAYGGNIMAHIRTPNHRPQFATVRYKVFPMIGKEAVPCPVEYKTISDETKLLSAVTFLAMHRKQNERGIEDADVIVVAGRGLKRQEDVEMVQTLADLLGGQLGCTRAMVEASWVEPRRQIGLSGRTVKPKLIITCAVSGAVQFAAGMNGSELIVAINNDETAPIFNIAHVGIVGDVYEIVPRLIAKIREAKGV